MTCPYLVRNIQYHWLSHKPQYIKLEAKAYCSLNWQQITVALVTIPSITQIYISRHISNPLVVRGSEYSYSWHISVWQVHGRVWARVSVVIQTDSKATVCIHNCGYSVA